jgi:hypothetical protein
LMSEPSAKPQQTGFHFFQKKKFLGTESP